MTARPTPPLVCHINLARGYRGGERQTELLVRGLADAGYRQILVARGGEPLAAGVSDVRGLEVRSVSGLGGAVLAAGGARLVHAHDGRSVHAAYGRALLSRVPYVITRRVDNPLRDSSFTRRVYRHAAAVVVLSSAIARVVADWQPGVSTVVIPSAHSRLPVDEARVADLRRDYANRFLVGHVGALDHSHKGQSDLIAAAKRLAGQVPDLAVMLVGSGRDEARFRDEAAEAGNVTLAGQVDNVGDYLAAFDLFAFPSLREGLGSVLLDAMDAGLPVVATRAGGIPDIVEHEVNGLLVPPADADALACAILRLHDDAPLRDRLSAAARETAARFDAARMVDRYRQLYASLLGDGAVQTGGTGQA